MNPISRMRRAFGHLRISQQLLAAFACLLVLNGLVGAVALVGLMRVDSQARALADKWLQGVGHLTTARAAVLESRDFEIKHSRTDDRSYQSEYEDKMAQDARTVAAETGAYEALIVATDERELFTVFSKAWASYLQAQKRVIDLGRDKKRQDAADISDGAASMALDESLGALDRLTRFNFEGGQSAKIQSDRVYTGARGAMLALLGVSLALGIALAFAITRHLLRLLGGEPGRAVAFATAAAAGDLTAHIDIRSGDTDSLLARLHAMQGALADAVRAVRRGSEAVAVSSAQIAQGNLEMSRRTEQEAGELQQTAATMEQLGVTVSRNADHARQASELAQGAATVAVTGGQMVAQVVETMKGINDSSRKIADITGVIDGIAFQTNILALNAAVEAARAGEQGRGFAVVAGEVRALAQRSAQAAREIKALISASVERVEKGSALVDHAGETMQQIVGAIQGVTDIVSQISAASAEQSAGVGQVGQAVSKMDKATQQNAAFVEQSAAAAENLKQQAEHLVDAVAVFRVGPADPEHAREPAPA